VLGKHSYSRTNHAVNQYGDESWEYDELNFWPVAAVTRGAEARLLYTVNHLTGRLTFESQRSGIRITGGTNTQDLMMAWMEEGRLKTQRLAQGFLRYAPNAQDPFPGLHRPLARAAVDRQGRIHPPGRIPRWLFSLRVWPVVAVSADWSIVP
jgi:hypothetical protein